MSMYLTPEKKPKARPPFRKPSAEMSPVATS